MFYTSGNKYSPQVGDVWWFSSSGLVPFIIKWRTWSKISHVGIVANFDLNGFQHKALYESTTLGQRPCLAQDKLVSGPQVQWLNTRITDKTKIWMSRPNVPLTTEQAAHLQSYLMSCIGAEYDMKEAMFSASYLVKLLKHGDPAKLFCSEYVLRGLMACSYFYGIRDYDPSDYNPGKLYRLLIPAFYKPARRIQQYKPQAQQ